MIFKEFCNIDINNKKGVSVVGKDSKSIAKHAANLKCKSILDIGTGTGFISIYLKKLGFECQGTDLNPLALNCAKENAEKNKVKINFYNSNLFENVNDKFDLIIFNPPYGGSASIKKNQVFEIIKSFFPKDNSFIAKIVFKLIKKQRRNLINDFLNKVNSFLNNKGKVLIILHNSELILVNKLSSKILDKFPLWDLNLVLLNKKIIE